MCLHIAKGCGYLAFLLKENKTSALSSRKKLSENQIAELAKILAELAKDIEAKGDKVPDSVK
ncbi:MAG: hypothetical protein QXL10_04115 [Candidatus Bathyarchaeia archaeon]